MIFLAGAGLGAAIGVDTVGSGLAGEDILVEGIGCKIKEGKGREGFSG